MMNKSVCRLYSASIQSMWFGIMADRVIRRTRFSVSRFNTSTVCFGGCVFWKDLNKFSICMKLACGIVKGENVNFYCTLFKLKIQIVKFHKCNSTSDTRRIVVLDFFFFNGMRLNSLYYDALQDTCYMVLVLYSCLTLQRVGVFYDDNVFNIVLQEHCKNANHAILASRLFTENIKTNLLCTSRIWKADSVVKLESKS